MVEIGLDNLFDFLGHNIDVSYQDVFVLKYTGLPDKKWNKTNMIDPLIISQRRSGCFLFFMITVHPYQFYPKFKYSFMHFRYCVQLLLDTYGVDAIIDT